MKAIWNEIVIAESENTIIVEGNHYFPPESVNKAYLKNSQSHTNCPWKGIASYYTVQVNEEQNPDAAWYYPNTTDLARKIEGYIAFWKGVEVTE